MNTTAEEHPRKDQLVDYGLGKIAEPDASRIGDHVEQCPDCQSTISDLHDDTFVALVRKSPPSEADSAASPPQGSISPEVTVAPESASGEAAAKLGDLPRELREHPRYEILDLIGRGGMGDVYRAQHKVMDRVVALKVIKPELVRNEAAVQRFRREVQAAARLHHGNIVTAFDAEQAGDVHFLVMEFVDGVNLDEVIRRGGPLGVAEACECIRQSALGLQHAHELGMVHRDIKPHNLIKSETAENDAVKILDFGLANFASETIEEVIEQQAESNQRAAAHQQLTEMGTMMGTPDFVAPEQAEDAHKADIRADIYSLGCTFFTLLTGRTPFSQGTIAEKIEAHAKQDAPPLADYRDDVPPEVEAILRKMMAKNPAERYQTPAELAEALVLVDVSTAEKPAAKRSPSPAKAPHRKRPRMIAAVALALLLPLFIVAGVIIYVETNTGKLEIDNRSGTLTGAKIVLTRDGKEYATFKIKPGQTVETIRAGEYEISIQGVDTNVELRTLARPNDSVDFVAVDPAKEPIAVYRGGGMIVEVATMKAIKAIDWTTAADADVELGDQQQQLFEAVKTFLAARDLGDYDALYDLHSDHAKTQVSREQIVDGHRVVGRAFGNIIGRELIKARLIRNPRGLPSGTYAGIEFKTQFEYQQSAWETLIMVLENDQWKVNVYSSLLKRVPFPPGENASSEVPPDTSSTPDDPAPASARISIAADGKLMLNDRRVPADALGNELRRLLQQSPELTVEIRADQDVPLNEVTQIMDLVKEVGIEQVSVSASTQSPTDDSSENRTAGKVGEVDAAKIATEAWLALADKGEFDKCYQELADHSRNDFGKNVFLENLTSLREGFGEVEERTARGFNVKYLGKMKVIEFFFITQFKQSEVRETVVTGREANGAWKVLGYTGSKAAASTN